MKSFQNTSTRNLLSQLHTETFIFDFAAPLTEVPEMPGYDVEQTGADCLEITMEKGQSLNAVFAALSDKQLEVRSMRTKANRLEELFVSLVQGHEAGEAAE